MAEAGSGRQLEQALWRVQASAEQRVGAGERYWYDNRGRSPGEVLVLQMTLAGSIVYEDAASRVEVTPGRLMLCRYGEASAYGREASDRRVYACYWMNLRGAGLIEQVDGFRSRYGSVLEIGTDSVLGQRMMEVGALSGAPGGEPGAVRMAEAVHGLVMAVFEWGHVRWTRRLSAVERAVDFLLREPATGMSLKEVASRFGCSREHLGRVFVEQAGVSPGRHVAAARYRQAMHLLEQTDLPLREVARQSGYQSVHTLIRQVRERRGVTPSKHRASLRR